MGLSRRGTLAKGMWADIAIFDPAKLSAPATFEDPKQLARGMAYVLVNGVPVIAQGRMTAALPGKVLRGPGFEGTAR
jgi:N-acyl-D-aspartate/D-glutamate deacylase